jgi:hypothetical protein
VGELVGSALQAWKECCVDSGLVDLVREQCLVVQGGEQNATESGVNQGGGARHRLRR